MPNCFFDSFEHSIIYAGYINNIMFRNKDDNQVDINSLKKGFYFENEMKPTITDYAYGKELKAYEFLKHSDPPSFNYWKKNPFSYRINTWGHRGDEPTVGSAVFLGCSYTWGWGMPEKWAWPWLVANEMGLNVTCLGVPGQGGDRAAMLALGWIRELKPRHVFWLDIFNQRKTWLLDWDDIYMLTHDDSVSSYNKDIKQLQKIAVSPAQTWFDIQRNCSTVQHLCNIVGSGYTRCGGEDYCWITEHPERGPGELLSRDGGNHPSRREHELIAQWMLDHS